MVESAEGEQVDDTPSPRSFVVDTLLSIQVKEQCFLDNTELLNEMSACLNGVDLCLVVAPSTRLKVAAATSQLSRRLQRLINTLPKHVRHNFVWAACRDNIHAFAQLLALLGQLPNNLEASSITESILKLHISGYHQPMESDSDDRLLEGVAMSSTIKN